MQENERKTKETKENPEGKQVRSVVSSAMCCPFPSHQITCRHIDGISVKGDSQNATGQEETKGKKITAPTLQRRSKLASNPCSSPHVRLYPDLCGSDGDGGGGGGYGLSLTKRGMVRVRAGDLYAIEDILRSR